MRVVATVLTATLLSSTTFAADLKIVSWNIGATPMEELVNREADLRNLDSALQPDVLILIEVTGKHDVLQIVKALGWSKYFAAVSDGLEQGEEVHDGLEVGLLSKVPISSVIEFDTSRDRKVHVFSSELPDGDLGVPVKEQKLWSASDPLKVAVTDRGTMRVDLANGLTIFPVHLKSNSNNVCFAASDAKDLFRTMGLPANSEFDAISANGNPAKAKEDMENAKKRERVIGAIKLVADEAEAEGREVLIAGDFNTSFEPGKVGTSFQDCVVQPFSCDRQPFPAAMCTGDGFDDTFAILTSPLVGASKWEVLTKDLGRTFKDPAFADKAIDHLAVPAASAAHFLDVGKAAATFGSDHFPIFGTFSDAAVEP